VLASIVVGVQAVAQTPQTKADYVAAQTKWRADYEESLKRERGWLKVAGLIWLKEGENTLGSAKENQVALPEGSTPDRVGVLTRKGGTVTLDVQPGVTVKIGDETVTHAEIKTDATEKPDRIRVGRIIFSIIARGNRLGVRLWDPEAISMKEFKGLKWYPVNSNYVIKAKFVPYNPPRKMKIVNVLGDFVDVDCPGYAEFTLNGKRCTLQAEDQGDTYFFNFRDLTSGVTTYGAGRFLDTDKPKDGFITLDFNQAYNPPCSYTPFATCALPPIPNRMTVPVRAGELNYHLE